MNSHPLPRRSFLRTALAVPALLANSSRLRAAGRAQRPNILFIQADDLGWRDLGCYGATYYETPAIDALAREGMRFTDAYAGAPICTPSRACLITGLHCARLHTTGQPGYKTEDTSARVFAHPDFKTSFSSGTPTVARTLVAAGYETVLLGKWGFDDNPHQHGFEQVADGGDDVLTERAVNFLGRSHPRPFFVHLNYFRPHVPLTPAEPLVRKYAARAPFVTGKYSPKYAATVEELDREVGRVLAALAAHGLGGDTVVIFGSDNGGFLGYDQDRIADNAPLREGKASLYEGGIRVPLIVRWPGVTRGRAVCSDPVHWVDWHSTLAEIAGTSLAAPTDGRSVALLLGGRRSLPPRSLYWHYPHYRRSMAGRSASPSSAIRDGDWKLLHFYEDDGVELYNLRDDPGERNDLAAAQPGSAAVLRQRLDAWRTEVQAQPPVRNPRPGRL